MKALLALIGIGQLWSLGWHTTWPRAGLGFQGVEGHLHSTGGEGAACVVVGLGVVVVLLLVVVEALLFPKPPRMEITALAALNLLAGTVLDVVVEAILLPKPLRMEITTPAPLSSLAGTVLDVVVGVELVIGSVVCRLEVVAVEGDLSGLCEAGGGG
jgi:hypothetical protein